MSFFSDYFLGYLRDLNRTLPTRIQSTRITAIRLKSRWPIEGHPLKSSHIFRRHTDQINLYHSTMTALSIQSAMVSFSSQGSSSNCYADTLIQTITHVRAERFCLTINCAYVVWHVRIWYISSSWALADKLPSYQSCFRSCKLISIDLLLLTYLFAL